MEALPRCWAPPFVVVATPLIAKISTRRNCAGRAPVALVVTVPRSTEARARFGAEDLFVFDAGFAAVGVPLSKVPGALPLGSDADAGTDFDAEDAEDIAFEAIGTEGDFVDVAALDSLDAAPLVVEDGFVAEEGSVVEGEYVAEDAFELDGACAGEECDFDEGSLTVWLPRGVRVLSSSSSPPSSMAQVWGTAAISTAATAIGIEIEIEIEIGAVSVSKASDHLLSVLVLYPVTYVMGHGP